MKQFLLTIAAWIVTAAGLWAVGENTGAAYLVGVASGACAALAAYRYPRRINAVVGIKRALTRYMQAVEDETGEKHPGKVIAVRQPDGCVYVVDRVLAGELNPIDLINADIPGPLNP